MGVVGSIGINVGQNIQATGMQSLPDELRSKPFKSKTWQAGTAIFAVFALINFSALALAPASVLTPLESIQFVTNVVYNRAVNKKAISLAMVAGVGLTIIGTVLSVLFGAESKDCPSLPQLQAYWASASWIVFLVLTLGIALACQIAHTRLRATLKRGGPLPAGAALWMPIAYTFASALAGGSQMIVHSKVFSILLSILLARGDPAPLATPLFYVELALVILQGSFWGVRLTECLGLYDPLLILPLMTGVYILFGGVAGGIFFQEFAVLHEGKLGDANWGLYLLGMALVVGGLGVIASASVAMESKTAETIAPDGGGPSSSAAARRVGNKVRLHARVPAAFKGPPRALPNYAKPLKRPEDS